jgi:hypothetical protein
MWIKIYDENNEGICLRKGVNIAKKNIENNNNNNLYRNNKIDISEKMSESKCE